MTSTVAEKSSSLPASAILLIVFTIVSWVVLLVLPIGFLLRPLRIVVMIGWSAKLIFDLVRWLRADKNTRPRMTFPKKSAGVLLVVILTVGFLGYLLLTEEPF